MVETSILTECIDANYFIEELCSYIDSDVGSNVAVAVKPIPTLFGWLVLLTACVGDYQSSPMGLWVGTAPRLAVLFSYAETY
jgi:hypothetical protein